jgi:maltose O-acetyltransferase
MLIINKFENLFFKLPYPLVNSRIRCQLIRRRGAKVGSDVSISRLANFLYPSNIEIGNDTVIGDCSLQAWASIYIGNNVIISKDAKLLTGNHNLHSPNFESKCRPIKIEDYVWIATNAIILGGVTLGQGAVVGAGAVVRKDVPSLGIVIGNPAQLIGFRSCNNFEYHPGRYLSQF